MFTHTRVSVLAFCSRSSASLRTQLAYCAVSCELSARQNFVAVLFVHFRNFCSFKLLDGADDFFLGAPAQRGELFGSPAEAAGLQQKHRVERLEPDGARFKVAQTEPRLRSPIMGIPLHPREVRHRDVGERPPDQQVKEWAQTPLPFRGCRCGWPN